MNNEREIMDTHNKYFGGNLPSFALENIQQWDEVEFQTGVLPFVREHRWFGSKTINVFDVVGTRHPDYHGMTWLEFILKGKRMPRNLDLFAANPDYYDDKEQKNPTMYYQRIDGGNLYVGDDGNHRTAIAKFGFYAQMKRPADSVLHGVVVTDYIVDWDFKHGYEQILSVLSSKKHSCLLQPIRTLVKRSDGEGWMCDHYSLALKVMEPGQAERYLLSAEDIRTFVVRINKEGFLSKIRRMFR